MESNGTLEERATGRFLGGWVLDTGEPLLFNEQGFFVFSAGAGLRHIANLPELDCGGQSTTLEVLWLSEARPGSCSGTIVVPLYDRPPIFNEVSLVVDTTGANTSAQLVIHEDDCTLNAQPTSLPSCKAIVHRTPTISSTEGTNIPAPNDFSVFMRSTDGSWEVLLGREEQHDLRHHKALLRSHPSGALFELESFDGSKATWPRPAARPLATEAPPRAIDLTDPSSQLRWLDGGRVLLVNSSPHGTDRSAYLFRLGEHVTRIEGRVLTPMLGQGWLPERTFSFRAP